MLYFGDPLEAIVYRLLRTPEFLGNAGLLLPASLSLMFTVKACLGVLMSDLTLVCFLLVRTFGDFLVET